MTLYDACFRASRAPDSRRRHFVAPPRMTASTKDMTASTKDMTASTKDERHEDDPTGMSGIQTVSDDEADIRLDRWFRRHFPGVPQSAIQKLCRTGQVRIDGKRAEAATRLIAGQAVRIPPLPALPAAKPRSEPNPAATREIEAMILYQDDHLIVLNKPYGLAVQGGPGISRHVDGMLEGLRVEGGDRPRLVHRLDRDTTGLLLIARTPGAAAKLA